MSPSQPILRDLRPEDIPAVAAIVAMHWPEGLVLNAILEMREMFGQARWRPHYIVAEIGGEIVGCAGFKVTWLLWNVYELIWVNIHQNYQRRGIGESLTLKRIDIIRTLGGKLILLMTREVEFFSKLLFRPVRKYDDWMLMSLKLGDVVIVPTPSETEEARIEVEKLRMDSCI